MGSYRAQDSRILGFWGRAGVYVGKGLSCLGVDCFQGGRSGLSEAARRCETTSMSF